MKVAVVKLELKRPVNQSLETLYKLISMWGFDLIKSGTQKKEAIIQIPENKFEKIFGEYPSEGKWQVPSGTTHFIKEFRVVKLKDIKHKKPKK